MEHLLDEDVVDALVDRQPQGLGLAYQHPLVQVLLLDHPPLVVGQASALLRFNLEDSPFDLLPAHLDDVGFRPEKCGQGEERSR